MQCQACSQVSWDNDVEIQDQTIYGDVVCHHNMRKQLASGRLEHRVDKDPVHIRPSVPHRPTSHQQHNSLKSLPRHQPKSLQRRKSILPPSYTLLPQSHTPTTITHSPTLRPHRHQHPPQHQPRTTQPNAPIDPTHPRSLQASPPATPRQ